MEKLRPIFTAIKIFVAIAILGGFIYYVTTYHKAELDKFYLKFDTWGITSIGRAELQRINAIEALKDKDRNVIKAQRDALINRTVFLGATDEMVTLALGKPIKDPEVVQDQQVWVYNFDDYSRPTYLYFERKDNKWILIKAEKANK